MRGLGLLCWLACATSYGFAAELLTAKDSATRLPGRYIVRLDPNQMHAASTNDILGGLMLKYDESMVAASSENDRVFGALQSAEMIVTDPNALQSLVNEDSVSLVEEVQEYTIAGWSDRSRRQAESSVPSWGMDRVNQRNLPLDDYIRGEEEMDASKIVTVYEIDTGIDYSVPEFEGRVVPAWSYFSTSTDGLGHGTHVAGVITSKTYGLSRAKVMSVKVLADDGVGSTSTVMAGLNYVVGNFDRSKPNIVSMSLTGGFSQAITDAVDLLVAQGVTVIAAAGNSNQNACLYSPASAPSAITVGSVNSTDQKSSFSNWGQCLDILAPGSSIISTLPQGRTGPMSGTSMSAPHVTAAAALYLGANPHATPAEITRYILDNATNDAATGFSADTVNRLLYIPGVVPPGPVTPPPPPPPPLPESTSIPVLPPTTPPLPPPVTTQIQPPLPTTQVLKTPDYTSLEPQPPVQKPARCQCLSLQTKTVTNSWCQKYNGCTYFKRYCYCKM